MLAKRLVEIRRNRKAPPSVLRLRTGLIYLRLYAAGSGAISANPPGIIMILAAVFALSAFGGGEGSRTPVRKRFNRTFSGRSYDLNIPSSTRHATDAAIQ